MTAAAAAVASGGVVESSYASRDLAVGAAAAAEDAACLRPLPTGAVSSSTLVGVPHLTVARHGDALTPTGAPPGRSPSSRLRGGGGGGGASPAIVTPMLRSGGSGSGGPSPATSTTPRLRSGGGGGGAMSPSTAAATLRAVAPLQWPSDAATAASAAAATRAALVSAAAAASAASPTRAGSAERASATTGGDAGGTSPALRRSARVPTPRSIVVTSRDMAGTGPAAGGAGASRWSPSSVEECLHAAFLAIDAAAGAIVDRAQVAGYPRLCSLCPL